VIITNNIKVSTTLAVTLIGFVGFAGSNAVGLLAACLGTAGGFVYDKMALRGFHIGFGELSSRARRTVSDQIRAKGDKHIVFCRASTQSASGYDWVYNSSNIAAQDIIWARDLGARENADLIKQHPDRMLWLVFLGANAEVQLSKYPENGSSETTLATSYCRYGQDNKSRNDFFRNPILQRRESGMTIISAYARKKKIDYLAKLMRPGDRVLEIGAASCWLRDALRARVDIEYVGLDFGPPADICGDIQDWRKLGLYESSFDWIVALEVVEHVPCYEEIYQLLKPGGKAFLTSPLPHFDWACEFLEHVGLLQKRTSAHEHLIYFEKIPLLTPVELSRKGFVSQWGLFEKAER
jgi:hypothetical protein